MKLLLFATLLVGLTSANGPPVDCSSTGVFGTLSGGDGNAEVLLQGMSTALFSVVPGGAALDLGAQMIDGVVHQQAQEGCGQAITDYLSQFFVTREDLNKALNGALSENRRGDMQRQIDVVESNLHKAKIASITNNPFPERLENYLEFAIVTSLAAAQIMGTASQNGGGNLDDQFVWVNKAFDTANQAFAAAQAALAILHLENSHFDKNKATNILHTASTILNNLFKVNKRFWDNIMPQNTKFENGQNRLTPQGIISHHTFKERKWKKTSLFSGECFSWWHSDLACVYSTPVHSVSKGEIRDDGRKKWRNGFGFFSRTKCEEDFDRSGDYGTIGCATCTRLTTKSTSRGIEWKDDEIHRMDTGYCDNHRTVMMRDAKWFYEIDDFVRNEQAFLKVWWKTTEPYFRYNAANFHTWMEHDYWHKYNEVLDTWGLLITDILFNNMVDIAFQYDIKEFFRGFKVSVPTVRQYKYSHGDGFDGDEFRFTSRRHLSESEIEELNKALDEKTAEELTEMEEKDPELMPKLLELGRLHSVKRPGPPPKPLEVANSDDNAMGEDGTDDDISAEIEGALAAALPATHSKSNIGQLGLCFVVGAGFMYLYKSYNEQKKNTVTYGLMTAEEI